MGGRGLGREGKAEGSNVDGSEIENWKWSCFQCSLSLVEIWGFSFLDSKVWPGLCVGLSSAQVPFGSYTSQGANHFRIPQDSLSSVCRIPQGSLNSVFNPVFFIGEGRTKTNLIPGFNCISFQLRAQLWIILRSAYCRGRDLRKLLDLKSNQKPSIPEAENPPVPMPEIPPIPGVDLKSHQSHTGNLYPGKLCSLKPFKTLSPAQFLAASCPSRGSHLLHLSQ